MNQHLLNKLAKDAKRDGLSLQWSMIHLIERLERNQTQIAHLRQQVGDKGVVEAHQLQLENEALALLILAVKQAYPAGADIEI